MFNSNSLIHKQDSTFLQSLYGWLWGSEGRVRRRKQLTLGPALFSAEPESKRWEQVGSILEEAEEAAQVGNVHVRSGPGRFTLMQGHQRTGVPC